MSRTHDRMPLAALSRFYGDHRHFMFLRRDTGVEHRPQGVSPKLWFIVEPEISNPEDPGQTLKGSPRTRVSRKVRREGSRLHEFRQFRERA